MGKQQFVFKGMTRDLDIAKSSNQYAYEVRNMRLTAQEESTLLAYTTEKGNAQYTLSGDVIYGTIVGYCVLNQYLVLFTHHTSDHIYRLTETSANTMSVTELYAGTTLGFSNSTKIDAIGVYENEDMQKVYWIDGEHQPRVINITNDYTTSRYQLMSFCPFDFVPEMALNETVTVTKQVDAYGVFTAGTIQYILCYSMNTGQRSNAFYVSPINYVTKSDRGGQPGETLSNAFRVEVSNVDTNWDNVIIYSVSRSSENSTPVCRKVVTLAVQEPIAFIDSGLNIEAVDYSEILYLGGGNIIPYTMEQKNNTLFFGNITDNSFYISTDSELAEELKNSSVTFELGNYVYDGTGTGYSYKFQLDDDQSEISTFINGELYKFGLIFQNKYGQWSNVLTVGDNSNLSDVGGGYFRCNTNPYNNGSTNRIIASINLSHGAVSEIESNSDIKRVKVVRLKDNPEVACQGVVCPTVFNKERKTGTCYSQSSWFFRATKEPNVTQSYSLYRPYSKHNSNIQTKRWAGSLLNPNTHYYMRGEIISGEAVDKSVYIQNSTEAKLNDSDFFIDWNVLTFHSPEIMYDKVNSGNFTPKLVGYTTMDRSLVSEYFTLNNVAACNQQQDPIIPSGTNNDTVWMSRGFYKDWPYMMSISKDVVTYSNHYNRNWIGYHPTFAWHRSDSLGNQPYSTADSSAYNGSLKTKCVASLRYSEGSTYLTTQHNFTNKNAAFEIKFYNDDGTLLLLPNDENNTSFEREKYYKGEIESLLNPSGYNLYFEDATIDMAYAAQYVTVTQSSISMKYKSTKHAVIDLGYDSSNKQCIPDVAYDNIYTGSIGALRSHVFWEKAPTINNPKIKAFIRCISPKDVGCFSGRPEIDNHTLPSVNCKYVIIRKGLVDLYGDIETNDYVVLLNSRKTILDDISLDYVLLRKRSTWPDDMDTIYPETSVVKNLYYIFQPVFSTSPDNYGTDIDTEYWKNNLYTGFTNDAEFREYWSNASIEAVYISSYSYYDLYVHRLPEGTSYTESTLPYNILCSNIISGVSKPYTLLVNLTRSINHITDFTNSQWIISGKGVSTDSLTNVIADIADAYYQRFDCLKTYPYSPDDPNQIVEIFSFMVQTRINLDGRWDINRGLMDNTIVDNTNFGLLNRGYTQEDNLFASSYLDDDKFNSGYHPNQIMWTGTKEYGADIDNWTHVIPTSVLDADGVYGKVTALKLWNNNLMFFQDKAFGVVQYNERNAIASTTGVPIELANSGKVDGKYYISNNIGCSNKESIQITHRGLYFADDNTREIYRYGSEGPECLSKSKGFNTYFYNPKVKFGKIKTFYDPKLKDVYFKVTTENVATTSSTRDVTPPTPVVVETSECLLFNEQYDEFMSFMGYDMDYMFPLGDDLISIKDSTLWKQFAGNYLSFFGMNKDYSLTFVSAENPTTDKTFTNIEFRADVLGNNDKLVVDANNGAVLPFTKIRAWNEYQDSTDKQFVTSLGYSWNTSQKFRIWRADIPRVGYMERIRNPWAKIKLSYHSDSLPNVKTIIHDVSVSYI